MDSAKQTIISAFMASPGPRSYKTAALLWGKGFCMGGADIIPGVSGGTIAFITGIYTDLINAIRSFDGAFVSELCALRFAKALEHVHIRFLACLLLGILCAIVSMAHVMHSLLRVYPVETWSLFFGLILASIHVVGRKIQPFNGIHLGYVFVGSVMSYFLVGMIPVATPETLPFIFFCGAVAVCAMILPGISGAFLLLMLGKYEYITGMLTNPFVFDHVIVLLVFVAGAGTGIVVFSRVLHYVLQRWHGQTVAVLTGFMLGALRKVWPWKDVLESTLIRGKVHVLREQNIVPSFNSEFVVAMSLVVVGMIVVYTMDRFSETSR